MATSSAAWVTVPVGQGTAPPATFWQLLVLDLRGHQGSWALVTPPGAADNGGLAFTAGTATGVIAGVRPSQQLTFSPLASTADLGRTWLPDVLPAPLAPVTDALAAVERGSAVAVVSAGTELLSSSQPGAGWQPVATPASLRATRPGCDPVRFTAVAVTGRTTYLGLKCRRPPGSSVAVSTDPRLRTWTTMAVLPPGTATGATVELVRLVATTAGLVALVSVSSTRGSTYQVGWWDQRGRAWTFSAPFAPSGYLAAVSVSTTGALAVLLAAGGARSGWRTDPARPSWAQLPQLPAGTVALALTGSGIDAFTSSSTTVTAFTLDSSGRWTPRQTLTVPVTLANPH